MSVSSLQMAHSLECHNTLSSFVLVTRLSLLTGYQLVSSGLSSPGATLTGAFARPEVRQADTPTGGFKRASVGNIEAEQVERLLPGTVLLHRNIMSLLWL